jgi:hypothetical protein
MELPGSAYLYTLATLAMTFAGLCAIVIVLRQTTGKDMSGFHIVLTRIYLESGLFSAAFCMLPPLLALCGLSETSSSFRSSLISHNQNSNLATFEIQVVPAAQRFLSTRGCCSYTVIWRLLMSALSNIYIPAARTHTHPLKIITLFFGLALGSFFCVAAYGLDLSPGLF